MVAKRKILRIERENMRISFLEPAFDSMSRTHPAPARDCNSLLPLSLLFQCCRSRPVPFWEYHLAGQLKLLFPRRSPAPTKVTAITALWDSKGRPFFGGASMIEAKVKLTFPETRQFMAQTG